LKLTLFCKRASLKITRRGRYVKANALNEGWKPFDDIPVAYSRHVASMSISRKVG